MLAGGAPPWTPLHWGSLQRSTNFIAGLGEENGHGGEGRGRGNGEGGQECGKYREGVTEWKPKGERENVKGRREEM